MGFPGAPGEPRNSGANYPKKNPTSVPVVPGGPTAPTATPMSAPGTVLRGGGGGFAGLSSLGKPMGGGAAPTWAVPAGQLDARIPPPPTSPGVLDVGATTGDGPGSEIGPGDQMDKGDDFDSWKDWLRSRNSDGIHDMMYRQRPKGVSDARLDAVEQRITGRAPTPAPGLQAPPNGLDDTDPYAGLEKEAWEAANPPGSRLNPLPPGGAAPVPPTPATVGPAAMPPPGGTGILNRPASSLLDPAKLGRVGSPQLARPA